MKTLTTETTTKGIAKADVHEYKSGVFVGRCDADWDAYRLWAEGPSDVCEAHRVLSALCLKALGITPDTVIFLLD